MIHDSFAHNKETSVMHISDQLQQEGYVVIRQAMSHRLIDSVLTAQHQSRRNPLLIFRGQGVVGYERARWNKRGQMVRSIQNPHLLGFAPGLSRALNNLIFSPEVAETLNLATQIPCWVNWQSMLFDRSVGTDIHLDTWFLDTNPRGSLIGIWIALEDITHNSGPFIVYPKSHLLPMMTGMSSLAELKTTREHLMHVLNKNQILPVKLLLKKGDIVLWSSLLAHGSDLPASDNETRKSVTAHFYPHGMKVNAPPIRRMLSIYNHKKPITAYKDRLYKAATISPFLYSTLCVSMFALQLVGSHSGMIGSIRRV